MSLLRRKNKPGIYVACISSIIFELLILFFHWYDCPKILKSIFIADILYAVIIFIGNLITSIQDKHIDKEIRKLGEENERLYDYSK